MPIRWPTLLLFVTCFVGCDNAARQQGDNAMQRKEVAEDLIRQGEAKQMQQTEDGTPERQDDGVHDLPEG